MSEAEFKRKMKSIGVCPQNYKWRRGSYESNNCDKCGKRVYNGYNCEGGGHYVCCGCVNTA